MAVNVAELQQLDLCCIRAVLDRWFFSPFCVCGFFPVEVFHRRFYLKEMWAHLLLKYRFVPSPLPAMCVEAAVRMFVLLVSCYMWRSVCLCVVPLLMLSLSY